MIRYVLVFLCSVITVFGGEVSSLKVVMKPNDGNNLGPTMESYISIWEDRVIVVSSGKKFQRRHILNREEGKVYKDHKVEIKDKQLATDLHTITQNPQLVNGESTIGLVSGGAFSTVFFKHGEHEKKVNYCCIELSIRRANLMENVLFKLNDYVEAGLDAENKKELALMLKRFKRETSLLADNIRSYKKAYSILKASFEASEEADWETISNLVQFRPKQPTVNERAKLVKESHGLLSVFCSEDGLQRVLGDEFKNTEAVLLKIGQVRRCKGSWSGVEYEGADWAFNDTYSGLGLTYLPHNPAKTVKVLDVGVERLVLHFLCEDIRWAPIAYNSYSLLLKNGKWDIADRHTLIKKEESKMFAKRVEYLNQKSGLLKHFFPKLNPEKIAYLDLKRIYIEDDLWDMAKIDYQWNAAEWCLPLSKKEESWKAYHRWNKDGYYLNKNSRHFKSLKELDFHESK